MKHGLQSHEFLDLRRRAMALFRDSEEFLDQLGEVTPAKLPTPSLSCGTSLERGA